MCGIAGVLNLTEAAPITENTMARMLGAIGHRGPDETGLYLDDWLGLGHVRLSIIDLTGGTQPISNEQGNLWVVFNGEIFNFPEIKAELVTKGHYFKTATDTEVLLHLYEEKGAAMLPDLNGQFAFAIWDKGPRTLFLARDRLGIIPLYYTIIDDQLVFASEIKSIFSHEKVQRRINPLSLGNLFTFWTTLPGETVFEGINELPPGHYLQTSSGKWNIKKYWQLTFAAENQEAREPISDCIEKTKALITDAVKLRLRADVPVACYLSGGLDSSGITALVKRHFNHQVRSFGIHFEEAAFDERDFQNQMVEWLGVDHSELAVWNRDIGLYFEEVLWHCEKPLLRTSPVPLYLLSKKVREEGFKVVLTGEGADEIFGGYNLFREAKIRKFWAEQPTSKLRPLLIQRLYPYVFQDKKNIHSFVQSFFGQGLAQTEDPLFSHLVRWRNTARIKSFFSRSFYNSEEEEKGFESLRKTLPDDFHSWDYLARAQYLEATIFLGNYLLSSQGDRMAMAHGVEIRPPYLDHRLVEALGQMPSRWKIKGLNEKYLLKQTLRDMLPEAIVNRPKHPYRAPIGPALLHQNSNYLREDLGEEAVRGAGYFDFKRINFLLKKLVQNPQPGEIDQMALAGVLSTQIIHRQFIREFPWRLPAPVQGGFFVDQRSCRS